MRRSGSVSRLLAGAWLVLAAGCFPYDIDVPIAYSADPTQATSARRMLQLTLDIEIVDQRSGKALWQRKAMVVTGEYAERAEAEGRRQAIERVVNDVIDGAQSQW